MITATNVAKYFLALANECEDPITNLKLNKLVYYAQAWHLALFGTSLFQEDIEAWKHGPVLPVIYDAYKHFRWTPITGDNLSSEEMRQLFSAEQQELLDDIVEIYFPQTAYALEQMTRDEDPWVFARQGLAPHESNIITHDAMRIYYVKMLLEETKSN